MDHIRYFTGRIDSLCNRARLLDEQGRTVGFQAKEIIGFILIVGCCTLVN